MRVLVLWADKASPNLGVQALAAGTTTMVHRVWPGAEVVLQSYGTMVPQLPVGRIRSLAKERIIGRKGMQRWLAEFDLVIDTRAGDSFSDIYGLRRLSVMSLLGEFAVQAGVPVVLGPQTIGPFSTLRGRLIARRSLRRASLIMARDTESAKQSRSLGCPVDVTTTDVVFALPVPTTEVKRDVLLNVSGLLWNANPHVNFMHYRATLTELYQKLIADGRSVALLSHSLGTGTEDNDCHAVVEFGRTIAPSAEIIMPTDLDDVRTAAASARVMIASRMHACLNALSVGTPAIPLAYSRKFNPLFRDLAWSHTVDLRSQDEPVAMVMRKLESDQVFAGVAGVRERAHESLATAQAALSGLR
jgi:colanic acid/amylovoran biosynthesis protein